MDPITTSPLEAHNLGNPAAPFYPAAAVPLDPSGNPLPLQPQPQQFGQPTLPAQFHLPPQPPSPHQQPDTTNDPAAFERALAAARGQGSQQPPSQPSQQPQPNGEKPATQPSPQSTDPSEWTAPNNRKKREQWDDLKDSFAKKEASWKQREAELLAGTNGDLTKLPFERLSAHPDVAKLKKERDEFFEDLRLIKTERDPEFVAKFNSQRDSVVKNLKFTVGGTGFEKIEKLLAEPASPYRDERIEQAMDGWKDATKARVHAAIATLDQVEFSRSAEAAQRAATFESKQLSALRESENRRTQQQEQMQRAFDGQLAMWQDPQQGMPFFQKTGDPKQDAAVESTAALARQIFNGSQTPEQLARYAMWAASAQRIYQQNEALLVELQRFQQQDSRLRESFPSVGPSGYSIAEQQRMAAMQNGYPPTNGHPANGFPAQWNPADPLAHAAAFEQGLEAARHAAFSGQR